MAKDVVENDRIGMNVGITDDDNSYNLQLHAGVLRKLGIHMYGSSGCYCSDSGI